MKISVISDLHCRNKAFPPSFDVEGMAPADVLVVAGDLGTVKTFYRVALNLSDKVPGTFGHALFVKGNHDYYVTDPHWLKHHPGLQGPHVNDNFVRHVDVGDEHADFICTPLWSPIRNHEEVRACLNDYNYIPGFTTERCTALFWENLAWLESEVSKSKAAGNKVVVVTHHMPLHELIDPRYEGSPVNDAFCVMDEAAERRIANLHPCLWIHGHAHSFLDKTVDGVRYVRNPYGYEWVSHDYGTSGREQTGYVKDFIVEI